MFKNPWRQNFENIWIPSSDASQDEVKKPSRNHRRQKKLILSFIGAEIIFKIVYSLRFAGL